MRLSALDGNGQFYLCLQDLALGNLSEQTERVRSTLKGESRRKVVIAIMDEGMFQKSKSEALTQSSCNSHANCGYYTRYVRRY